MPDPEKTEYHFEQASSPEELKKKSEVRYRQGWRKASEPREVEVSFPSDRSTLVYSQSFSRTVPGTQRMMRCMSANSGPRSKVFWGEISPCEHWLQIYPDDDIFFESLGAFVMGGLVADETVVVIAIPGHRAGLLDRLAARGVDVSGLCASKQLVILDADEMLGRFMVNGWPDESLFRSAIGAVLDQARAGSHRRIRAFGEMVAILWARNDCGATVRLEHLWHVLCQLENLALFCAYPRSGFTHDRIDSLNEICAAHSRIIP
jgi:hypothetical protein